MPLQAQDALNSTHSFWFMVDMKDGWIAASMSLREVHAAYPSISSKPRFAIDAERTPATLRPPGPQIPSTGWLGELVNHKQLLLLMGTGFDQMHP